MGITFSNRIFFSILTVVGIIIIYTLIFSWSMLFFEDQQITFAQSLQVVVESLTTSGYGGYSPWETDFLNYFIVLMNLTGVVLVFFAFPVLIVPMLKNAIEKSPPKKVSKSDHVIICTYSTHAEVLIQELDSRGKDYVIVEPDEEKASHLYLSGMQVILGDPESDTVLKNAGLETASTLVLHSTVEKSISTILSVRSASESINIIAVLIQEEEDTYYRLAGADITISPRQLTGESLAKQVPSISINDSVEIDNNIEVIEIDIEEGSELCNKSVGSTKLLDNYHVNIIGAWLKDEFKSPVSADLILDSKIRLLVAGEKEEIDKLSKKAEATTRPFRRKEILILGYGQSGQAAAQFLKSRSVDVKVIDIRDKDGVDVTGDITKPETLSRAGIDEISSIIITIKDDSKAIYATLIARNMNAGTHIIVRANKKENVRKLYDAGADYVQAVTTVSGRMLAASVFDDEASLGVEKQINLKQLPAGHLAGSTLAKSNVRAETGCTILMVIRDGKNIMSPDPKTFKFKENDQVIMAGTDNSIYLFEEKYLSR